MSTSIIADESGRPIRRVPRVISGTVNGINAAGLTTLTTLLRTLYNSGWLKGIYINSEYAGGPNGSFKAQAGGGRRLTLILNIREPGAGAFRRITPNSGEYRIRTTDSKSMLSLPHGGHVAFSEDLQIQIDTNPAPVGAFDIQWVAEVDQFATVVR